jgi:hypothetical protein
MTTRKSHAPERAGLLSPRQRQVLRLQSYGYTYQDISDSLGLSIWTIKNHHREAVRGLSLALKFGPDERIRTSLACYILGLLDGGLSPQEVALRLREITPGRITNHESGDEVSSFAAD